MIRLYGIPNCDNCSKALKWLAARNIEVEFVDLRKTMPSKSRLQRWQDSVDWEKLINKRSVTWRKIPEADRQNTDAESAIDLMLEYPTVIKRPVLELDQQVILGFDPDTYKALKL